MNRLWQASIVAVLATAWVAAKTPSGTLEAQAKATPAAKVDVVLERYQGEKKISSLPYSMWVTMSQSGNHGTGSLRIGIDVPIGSSTRSNSTEGRGGAPGRTDTTTAPEYRNIGTSIDCYLQALDDGRYTVSVSLTDMSIYDPGAAERQAMVARGLAPNNAGRSPDASVFRTFSLNNSLVMRDGQTAEFANATDKTTGEVVKELVTLSVAK